MYKSNMKILSNARLALEGKNIDGELYSESMFSPNISSFSHGDGCRRPYFEVTQQICEAVYDAKRFSLEDYHHLKVHEELESIIIKSYNEKGVPEHLSKNISIEGSVTRIITSYLNKICPKNSVVLTSAPIYHPLIAWCHENNLPLHIIKTRKDNDFKLTPKEINHYCQKYSMTKVSTLVLFNPGYTGSVYTKNEIDSLAKELGKYDITIIEDNVFGGTEFKEESKLIASSKHLKNPILVCSGLSKKFNLANLRLGWMCGSKKIVNDLKNYNRLTYGTVTMINQHAAITALRSPNWYYLQNNQCLKDRVRKIEEEIISYNVQAKNKFIIDYDPIEIAHSPYSGHSLLISFNALKFKKDGKKKLNTDVDITLYLQKYAKVSFAPGSSHGLPGYHRLAYGCYGASDHYDYQTKLERDSKINSSKIKSYKEKGGEVFKMGTEKIIKIFNTQVFPIIDKFLGDH
ncbi:pyridoxal phosphate-dependent aminotransferase [bacterium]|nr:pyridoxal phosphate-dependent aminotransferase [bacterium]